MQQKVSPYMQSSAPNISSRRRSTELPGIRDVLGHELCSGGSRRRSSSRELLLGSHPRVLSISSSPGKPHGYSNPTHALNPRNIQFSSVEQPVTRRRGSRHSYSLSGTSLPAILQKLHMEDDVPWEKSQTMPSTFDRGTDFRRHSWNHQADPSKVSLNAYNYCVSSDANRLSSPAKLSRSRRREQRLGDPTRLEPYGEHEPSVPINIPENVRSRSSDDLSSHALSRSYSSYSASYNSENFPHTPRQEAIEPLAPDFRMTWSDAGSNRSPVQNSKSIFMGPMSTNAAETPRAKTPEGTSLDDKDMSPAKTDTNLKPRGKGSGMNGKFECSYCNKRFTRPSSLRTHIHSHTGEKPFRCDAPGCGRCFSVHSNLRRHQRSHNMYSISPIKPKST